VGPAGAWSKADARGELAGGENVVAHFLHVKRVRIAVELGELEAAGVAAVAALEDRVYGRGRGWESHNGGEEEGEESGDADNARHGDGCSRCE